jgi:hypothetical protein
MSYETIKTLVLKAVHDCGNENVENVVSVIEEQLSIKEADDVRKFLTWAFFDWLKRGFGRGNFDTRWNKWRDSLAGKKPCKSKDVRKLIAFGQKILATMQESDRTTNRLKADLKEFLAKTGITRGQLKRGY